MGDRFGAGSGGAGRLGVTIAVRDEAAAILAEPGFRWEEGPRGVLRSARYPISLMLSGVGKAYAARSAAILAAECGALCPLGTAGGLSDEPVGTLYLCERAVEHDMDVSGLGFAPGVTPFAAMDGPELGGLFPAWRATFEGALADAGLPYAEGLVASGDRFLADPAVAAAVRTGFGAALADMESAAVAKVAMLEGLSFCTLRWISDNADHDSPTDWPTQVARSSDSFRRALLALGERLVSKVPGEPA